MGSTKSTPLNQKQLREHLGRLYGATPHSYTIRDLMRQGMPSHRHPWNSGHQLFYLEEVLPWLEARMKQPAKSRRYKKSA